MIACPAIEQLAAIASGEGDVATLAHATGCAKCAALLDDQATTRELVHAAPVPAALSAARRAELAATLLAAADTELDPPRRASWRIAGLVALAVAAAAAIAIALIGHDAPPAVAVAQPALVEGVPAIARMRLDGVERVTPGEGTIVVDAVHRTRLDVTVSDTRIAVTEAKVAVTTRRGVIQEIAVFAGSVELITRGDKITLERGMVWTRPTDDVAVVAEPDPTPVRAPPPPPKHVAPPPPRPELTAPVPEIAPTPLPDTGMGAFRVGWTELHAGDFAAAADAFDRATDAVIAEDAAYWAAIATLRAGDRAGAIRRLQVFLTRFPDSTRADDARIQLVRLGSRG